MAERKKPDPTPAGAPAPRYRVLSPCGPALPAGAVVDREAFRPKVVDVEAETDAAITRLLRLGAIEEIGPER